MKAPVKKRRAYRSVRRAEQAEETRRRILAAARKVFISHGYSRATMAQVATEAQTAVETIYAAFGNKAELLTSAVRELLHIGGKVPYRSDAAEAVRLEPDPRRAVHLFAASIIELLASVAPMMDVVARARAEPAIGALYEGMHETRWGGLRAMVGWLADKGGLRPGLTVDAGADTVWALANPELYRQLTELRGWSIEQFAAWLEDSLARALLA